MKQGIFSPAPDMNQRHIELIAAVNNATTEAEHTSAKRFLDGWRWGIIDAQGRGYDWTIADLHHEGSDAERPMVLGVFLDWKPTK